MTDIVYQLFPLAALITGAAASMFVWRRTAIRDLESEPQPSRLLPPALRACLSIVAVQHVLLLATPLAVLRWNAGAWRLLATEAACAAAGCGCVAAAIVRLRAQLATAPTDVRSLAGTLAGSVAAVLMVSGVAIAGAYRWASSWSVVTLTPYVMSLATPHPRVELVRSTPFLVRMHVLGAFALLAVVPFSAVFARSAAALRRKCDALAIAALRAARTVRPSLGAARLSPEPSSAIWREEER